MVIEWEHVQYAMQNPTRTGAICVINHGREKEMSKLYKKNYGKKFIRKIIIIFLVLFPIMKG